jgi:hypothetical protein
MLSHNKVVLDEFSSYAFDTWSFICKHKQREREREREREIPKKEKKKKKERKKSNDDRVIHYYFVK